MSSIKTSAVVLRIIPYRESSGIVHLYTDALGKVSGIAKGIRKSKEGSTPFERGFRADLILYTKPNRDLHTVTDIQITDFFPETRVDIDKTSLRDAAFELLLKGTVDNEPHPELYTVTVDFLKNLELTPSIKECFVLLWGFLFKFSSIAGFHLNLNYCSICNAPFDNNDGFMLLKRGGIGCPSCCIHNNPATRISKLVLDYLNGQPLLREKVASMHNKEFARITRLLLAHCRYRLDIPSNFSTISFIDSILV